MNIDEQISSCRLSLAGMQTSVVFASGILLSFCFRKRHFFSPRPDSMRRGLICRRELLGKLPIRAPTLRPGGLRIESTRGDLSLISSAAFCFVRFLPARR